MKIITVNEKHTSRKEMKSWKKVLKENNAKGYIVKLPCKLIKTQGLCE